MTRPPPPAAPTHLLRSHSHPISALWITPDNERVYSGDADGKVVVTSTHTLRAITIWKAHTDGVLGVQETHNHIITQGRDHKLHVWDRIQEPPASRRLGGSAALPDLPVPNLAYSMDVNSLNYCRFSVLSIPMGSGDPDSVLITLPNLVDSTTADIWALPKRERLHAAIGQETNGPILAEKPDSGRGSNGIIMSMHCFLDVNQPASSSSTRSTPATALRLICAYESGAVTLRRYTRSERPKSVEGQGWEVVWTTKTHVESVMAMAVSRMNTFALAVSADHLITKYSIDNSSDPNVVVHRTKNPGNSSIAIRDDGKVFAVGGWDGCIRLYSTKSFKALGTLRYHKTSIQCIALAHPTEITETASKRTEELSTRVYEEEDEDSDDDEISASDREKVSRWLIAGGKDTRVSIWELMSFEAAGTPAR